MTEISWSTVAANAVAFLTCASILGGFFMRYARAEGRNEIDASIAKFEREKIAPLIERFSKEMKDMADLSSRVAGVQSEVKTLNKTTTTLAITVAENAKQARDDLTGLATRIESSTKSQTDLLVKLIEAGRD